MAKNKNTIRSKLYSYQLQCLEFVLRVLAVGCGAALLLDMGLGKTIISLAVISELFIRSHIRKVLIVCPNTLLKLWEHEAQKFADFPYKFVIVTGNKDKKSRLLRETAEYDDPNVLMIVAISYDSMRNYVPNLIKYAPDMIIADEGHKMKDQRTKQSQCMHELGDTAGYKLLLTGTPICNDERDIWSQYRFLDSSVFGDYFSFWRRYFFKSGAYEICFKSEMKEDLREKIFSIGIRLEKKECLDLPGITYTEIPVVLEPSAMKEYKRLWYDRMLKFTDESIVSPKNILTELLRLSQFTGGFVTDENGRSVSVSNAKLNALSELLDSIIEEKHKAVVIAHYVPELKAIEELLDNKGIDYARYRGAISNAERNEGLKKFDNDPECKVLVAQLQTVGLGLNLTVASKIIFYSVSYSAADYNQCRDRIYRIGQTEKCQCFHLVAQDTIDEDILYAIANKESIAHHIIDKYGLKVKSA